MVMPKDLFYAVRHRVILYNHGEFRMSWLTNVVVVGTPVDGIATVNIPLPGSNMALESNFRQTAIGYKGQRISPLAICHLKFLAVVAFTTP